eukprot:CAMPEP_0115004262 /NCGR_PEP_ID=MMETSP0216-20121206/19092_1 /TAXON_ID=223996 /ORGANISM="Protocruzia adherens, Strain Boccale" /LENGTH=816 /DNA_ID=CAMNT_0002370205 /DNA_START=390 /DNA_END=2840 /DNA_ORIENTATION=+
MKYSKYVEKLNKKLLQAGITDYCLTPTLLGKGNFAKVFQGKKLSCNLDVAIKVIRTTRKKSNERLPRKYLDLEIKILKTLKSDNIVTLIDSFAVDKYQFLILEYCNSGDLKHFLQRNAVFTGLPEATVRDFMQQISSALQTMQSHRVIHRDLKLENILVNSDDKHRIPRLKIADFGLAKFLEEENLIQTHCGTPIYEAPEMLKKQKYGEKVDLWAIGVILYQLITGEFPFLGANREALIWNIENEEFEPPMYISDCCMNLLNGLLEKNPADRFDHEQFFSHSFITGIERPRNDSHLSSVDMSSSCSSLTDDSSMASSFSSELSRVQHSYASGQGYAAEESTGSELVSHPKSEIFTNRLYASSLETSIKGVFAAAAAATSGMDSEGSSFSTRDCSGRKGSAGDASSGATGTGCSGVQLNGALKKTELSSFKGANSMVRSYGSFARDRSLMFISENQNSEDDIGLSELFIENDANGIDDDDEDPFPKLDEVCLSEVTNTDCSPKREIPYFLRRNCGIGQKQQKSMIIGGTSVQKTELSGSDEYSIASGRRYRKMRAATARDYITPAARDSFSMTTSHSKEEIKTEDSSSGSDMEIDTRTMRAKAAALMMSCKKYGPDCAYDKDTPQSKVDDCIEIQEFDHHLIEICTKSQKKTTEHEINTYKQFCDDGSDTEDDESDKKESIFTSSDMVALRDSQIEMDLATQADEDEILEAQDQVMELDTYFGIRLTSSSRRDRQRRGSRKSKKFRGIGKNLGVLVSTCLTSEGGKILGTLPYFAASLVEAGASALSECCEVTKNCLTGQSCKGKDDEECEKVPNRI